MDVNEHKRRFNSTFKHKLKLNEQLFHFTVRS